MKKIMLLTLILMFTHTGVFAQDVRAEKNIKSQHPKSSNNASTESSIHVSKKPSKKGPSLQDEKNFDNRSKEVIETATSLYKELLPMVLLAVKKNG